MYKVYERKVMTRLIKKYSLSFLVAITAAFMCYIPAYAAKSIDRVSISISGNIKYDTRIGEENLTITGGAGHYSFEEYDVKNSGFKWGINDVPQIEITFTAEDNYYFNIKKASQITIDGGSYVTARRENSSQNLIVTVKLPALNTQVGEITTATIDDKGNLTWSLAEGAGCYEVKLMRGNSVLDGSRSVYGNNINLAEYFTKEGTYRFKVRPVNNVDINVRGMWADSNDIYISESLAKYYRDNTKNLSNDGAWMKDQKGWYYLLNNGTRVINEWKKINGEWYCFLGDGYMATGWVYSGNDWYYLDKVNGNMLKNTVTPDGYELTINGTWVQK